MKKQRMIEIQSICPECAGRQIVPHRHITNKRNKKQCPTCKGNGEILKLTPVDY